MINQLAYADPLTITAPGALSAGVGIQVGGIFGVTSTSCGSGDKVSIRRFGVFRLPKLSTDVPSIGTLIYWDSGNSRCTTTAGSNKLIGSAVAGQISGDTTVDVLLTGQA